MLRKKYSASYETTFATTEEGDLILSQYYEAGEPGQIILSIHQAQWLYDNLPTMIKDAQDTKDLYDPSEE